MFKTASNNVHTSIIGGYLLIDCLLGPSTSSAKKTQGNTEQDPDNPRPVDEGDNKIKCPLLSCTAKIWQQ
jgi:hypothetical protein